MATINAFLLTRTDTATNWTSANTVLQAGEQAYESDTGKTKFGDGSTAWSSLPYTIVFTLNDTASNTTKLALTGIHPGHIVRVTGEANRIEQYLGTSPASDANWMVLRNTVFATLTNNLTPTAVLAGVSVPTGTVTAWIDPSASLEYSGIVSNQLTLASAIYDLIFGDLSDGSWCVVIPTAAREAISITLNSV